MVPSLYEQHSRILKHVAYKYFQLQHPFGKQSKHLASQVSTANARTGDTRVGYYYELVNKAHQEDRSDGVLLPVQQREQRGEGEEAAAEEGQRQAPDRQDPQQPRGAEQRQRLQASSGSQQLHKGTKLQLK